jgi:hypothetical protein
VVIAYLKALPPVDNVLPQKQLGWVARYYVLTTPDLLSAATIDHNAPPPDAPEPGLTVEYGSYLAVSCGFCHGEDLAGGLEPGAGLNLTPAGDLGNWTEEDFIRALRTGYRPDGRQLKRDLMPWDRIGEMSDLELRAIWLYLQSLPPVQTASR